VISKIKRQMGFGKFGQKRSNVKPTNPQFGGPLGREKGGKNNFCILFHDGGS
jgi:hypothetical protein